jgi:hypothetical protein
MAEKTLKEKLARYFDPEAFKESVPNRVKHTCAAVAKTEHDKLKARRIRAMDRAGSALGFFTHPENLRALNRRVAISTPADAGMTETGE